MLLDNFVINLIEVRQSEYKRLIIENIIAVGKRQRKKLKKLKHDRTSKQIATSKDRKVFRKMALWKGKRSLLQKTNDDETILTMFNNWNTNSKIHLNKRHMDKIRKKQALPLYRGTFHKLLLAFLIENIEKENVQLNQTS